MEVNKEIEEMLNGLGDQTPEAAKQEEEVEGTREDVVEEKEETKAEAEAEQKEEDSSKEGEKKEEEPEETDKDKIIEYLRQQLNERHLPQKEEVEKKETKEEKKEEKKEEPLTLAEQDFIGELDLDDLVTNKETFNKLLNVVYSKGVNDSKKIATEGVLMTIPDIVKYNISLISSLEKARDKFYSENKDLEPFKPVVAAVYEEIAAKNTDKKIEEVMTLVAPEVRKRLSLHLKAKEEEKSNERSPRLPSSKGGPRGSNSKPETSALSKELEEMNKYLGR